MNFTVGLESSAVQDGFKAHAVRGTGRYVAELLRYFEQNQPDDISVTSFSQAQLFERSLPYRITEFAPVGRQTIRQQFFYPFWLTGKQTKHMDILHFPAHIDSPSWTPKKYIVTVLDLIPVVLKELYRPEKMTWRFTLARWLELKAIKNADLILTISEHTALDVHRVLDIPYEKIRVTPLGVREEFFHVSRDVNRSEFEQSFKIPADVPVVLYVGGVDQRKNMSGLVDIFKQVVGARREKGLELPRLVLVGDIRRDKEYPVLQNAIKRSGIEDLVIETGFVPDRDLLLFYARSDVFLFPSLYEGFGLPPLEAMAAGTPVVSSNTSAMPEVLSDAALLFAPSDTGRARDHVLQILENSELREELSAAGRKQAGLFSWDNTGEKTLDAYRDARRIVGR